jgi:precorrin-8X/cobalt-precorrin-8 methylmutase
MDYVRDPDEIYRQSFAIVRAETDLSGVPDDMADVVIRLVHACGMPEIVGDLRWSDGVAAAARTALAAGAPVICDAQMVADGVIAARLPAGNQVVSMIRLPNLARLAQEQGTTRSAAQVELWKPFLPGSIVAIGNAPTALFRLLEIIAEDPTRKPAAILGFPVGFVGAAESKDALHDGADNGVHDVPYVTILGRRGGSAMAAAAVNALAGRYQA